jgi:glycosyltransferase involved in cell wall biosynthesis
MINVGIIICIYQPNYTLLSKLIESIKAQEFKDWECQIYLDSYEIDFFQEISTLDSRFIVTQRERNLGIYENFRIAIEENLNRYDYLFLSDQDDYWFATKLTSFIEKFEADTKISLLYSDAEVRDESDCLLYPSLNELERRRTPKHWQDLIIKNAVSGTTLALSTRHFHNFLCFPPQSGWHHDLWLALVALHVGRIECLDKPQMVYVQHSKNTIGAKKYRIGTILSFAESLHSYQVKKSLFICLVEFRKKHKFSEIRFIQIFCHFCRYLDLIALLQILIGAIIVGMKITYSKVKMLSKFAGKAIQKSVVVLKYGIILVRRILFDSHFRNLLKLDILNLISVSKKSLQHVKEESLNFSPLRTELVARDFSKYLIVLPSLQPPIYGGIATALKLACELRNKGQNVRIATYNLEVNFSEGEQRSVADFLGLDFQILNELVTDSDSKLISLSANDTVIVTAWWTCEELELLKVRFNLPALKVYYFIQDFECLFYPASYEFSRALSTYEAEHNWIVNSASLANFLDTLFPGRVDFDLVLEPQELFRRQTNRKSPRYAKIGPIKIIIYGRPNTPRNLFDLVIATLNSTFKFFTQIPFEVVSVGEHHGDVVLDSGLLVKSLGDLSYSDYHNELKQSHIGISLMLSPHPSYPPLEMLNMGLYVLTNDFLGFKKPYLTDSNLFLANPDINSLSIKLSELIQYLISGTENVRTKNSSLGLSCDVVVSNLIEKNEVWARK